MDSKTYITNAIKTEGVPESLEINQIALHAVLDLAIHAAKVVDLVKRRLYYGKEIPKEDLLAALSMTMNLSSYLGEAIESGVDVNTPLSSDQMAGVNLQESFSNMSLENLDKRLLHCAVGCFTESGELLEAMLAQYATGVLDRVNFGEEVGDIEWYQAIGFDASGVSEADCREKNIAKLKARYPGKFDAAAAINRDTAVERAILEGAATA